MGQDAALLLGRISRQRMPRRCVSFRKPREHREEHKATDQRQEVSQGARPATGLNRQQVNGQMFDLIGQHRADGKEAPKPQGSAQAQEAAPPASRPSGPTASQQPITTKATAAAWIQRVGSLLPGVNYVGGSRQLRWRVGAPNPLPWQGVGARHGLGLVGG